MKHSGLLRWVLVALLLFAACGGGDKDHAPGGKGGAAGASSGGASAAAGSAGVAGERGGEAGAVGEAGAGGVGPIGSAGAAGAPASTPIVDYLDKTDLIPIEFGLLSAGASPDSFPASVLAQEPAFYTQATLLSLPAGSGFLGLTAHSRTDEVRWQIAETTLSARRASELSAGSTPARPVIGDVVAAFNVLLHFDIKEVTDPNTHQTRSEEDTTSRPWYQRRYVRIDWSQNVASASPIAAFDFGLGTPAAQALPFVPASADDSSAPFFDYTANGDTQRLDYFDIVNAAEVHPDAMLLDTDPSVPICALGEGDGACSASKVTYRVAFARVDHTRDYQSVALGSAGLETERFGVEDTASVGPYALDSTASSRPSNAVRHNIWLSHHALAYGKDTKTPCNSDADCGAGTLCHIQTQPMNAAHRGACAPGAFDHNAADASCTTDADCALYASGALSRTAGCDAATKTCGERFVRCAKDADCASVDAQSTCDTALASVRADGLGLCLMPLRARQVRPIAFFESPNFPQSLEVVASQALSEWNSAFSTSVAQARRHECELESKIDPSSTPDSANACTDPSVTGLEPKLGADAAFVVVGCHNPVWGTADGPGQHSAADVAAANAAGWDLAACGAQGASARLGDLRHHLLEAVTDQDDSQDSWGLSNVAADARSGEIVASRALVWKTVTDAYAAEVASLVHLLNGEVDPSTVGIGLDDLELGHVDVARSGAAGAIPGFEAVLAGHSVASLVGDGTSTAQALLGLKGTSLERSLLNSDQARLANNAAPDDAATSPTTLDVASPLREQSPAFRRSLESLRSRLRSNECRMLPGFSADRILDLARWLEINVSNARPITASQDYFAQRAFGQDWSFVDAAHVVDYALVEQYASLAIAHVVLMHELGHAFGLRDNFAGSADALNYQDGYWQARGKGHPKGIRPRYEYLLDSQDGEYYSSIESASGIEEYSYSSVMDDRDVNQVSHGLGRYDVAAIKSLYGNLVEAFSSVADADGALTYAFNVAGPGLSTPLDLRAWPGAIHGVHYTQIPALFGARADGTPNIADDNRYDIFANESQAVGIPGWGLPLFSNGSADGHVLVPYRYASDPDSGLVWQNQRGDVGADASEVVSSLGARVLNGYYATSFSHATGRLSAAKYVNHLWSRAIDPLRQAALVGAFDLVSYQDRFGTVPNWAAFVADPAEFSGVIDQSACCASWAAGSPRIATTARRS